VAVGGGTGIAVNKWSDKCFVQGGGMEESKPLGKAVKKDPSKETEMGVEELTSKKKETNH